MENDSQTKLSTEEHAAWSIILRAQANVNSALDKQLAASHQLGVSDFDVLSCLANSPDHSLRMTELAHDVRLSPSGLTRRLDGLVRQGLVERKPAPSDGRGLLAELTPSGYEKVRQMEPTYTNVLNDTFVRWLDPHQLKEIRTMLEPMADQAS
jgi:DNA-binding MarR family transcriptional regulator